MVKRMWFRFFVFMTCLITACSSDNKQKPGIAFYYWRTDFSLKPIEQNILDQNKLTRLYLRYFDVVYDEESGQATPVAPVHAKQQIIAPLVPVVFIRNKVFEQTDSFLLDSLAEKVLLLAGTINKSLAVLPQELQVDCDWTSGTSVKYFYFLSLLKEKLRNAPGLYAFAQGTLLSATIRLHQVKYPGRQGVPPVNKGVLMFYNMGKIAPGSANSIYQKETALNYIRALKKYPLDLDFALPVFSWGVHIRDGRVMELLNKMDHRDFENKNEFKSSGNLKYVALKTFFKNGFYFKTGDGVKVEEVSAADLKKMAEILKKYYDRPVHRIIFYDLDSINISRYEENIFKKVSDRF